ncbi:transcription termination/antitermination NusG family protein [Halomonas sp. Bachu 37]|uniref:transcription termination/antitermination protein NusG n=1 Tax=Halomonas kashgarensis TaxID=3084920 RepID=UPI003217ACBE
MNEHDATYQWYAVQCKGGESFRAEDNLANQGFNVFHPILRRQRKRNSRLEWITEPLFPYYLFIELDQVTSNWRPIRSTRGVLRLLSFGNNPAPVPSELIQLLQGATITPEAPDIPEFAPGETIHIEEGPFAGQGATFVEYLAKQKSGEARAIVLLDLLNRPQRLEISLAQLLKSCN